MEWIDRLTTELPLFLLTGVRVSGLLLLAPVFGQKSLPPAHRVWMGLLLSLLLLPAVNGSQMTGIGGIGVMPIVAKELAVGLLLGFTVMLFLLSPKYAGRLVGVHIGFGLASMMDPITKEQNTLIDQLQGLMVLVLFLSLGGHRMILKALSTSFALIPIGAMELPPSIVEGLVRLFCEVIVLGIQIAIPVMGSVFLTEIAIGILSRGVPQLNIFTIGLPLRIVVGVLVLSATMPLCIRLMKRLISTMPSELLALLTQLAP